MRSFEELMSEKQSQEQLVNQKKAELAGSQHAPVIIELMKDCMSQTTSLIGKTQWDTSVNAITLEIQSAMIKNMVISNRQKDLGNETNLSAK